jgi:hypothetical protein
MVWEFPRFMGCGGLPKLGYEMERIATRVAGFILVFVVCLSITEGWNIYVRIVILLLLVVCAFISTGGSILLRQKGVIEASSHLTILMLPIFGLVYLSRLKFLYKRSTAGD